jgi:hypothetical protein
LLKCQFEANGIQVREAVEDADTLIVATALQLAVSSSNVVVVTNDTDVLLLLMHHFKSSMCDMYMHSEVSGRHGRVSNLIPIRQLCQKAGDLVCRCILVIHAISGCDTTSALFGIGKRSAYRKLKSMPKIVELTEILSNAKSLDKQVSAAGQQMVLCLYGASNGETLNALRHRLYMHFTVTRSTIVKPEKLPPTEHSCDLHVKRVHLQALQWESLSTEGHDAERFGWRLVNNQYTPIASTMAAAPDDLLKLVRCSCKNESRNQCATALCSCFNVSLRCVAACKNCVGLCCNNRTLNYSVDEPEEGGFHCETDGVLIQDVLDDVMIEDDLECFMPWMFEELV